MAFLDKLIFWKKKDTIAELDKQLGALGPPGQMPPTQGIPTQGIEREQALGLETGYGVPFGEPLSPSMSSIDTGLEHNQHDERDFEPFGMEHPSEERRKHELQQYEKQPSNEAMPQNIQQQLELVAAKLDTIRVSLESINHRLAAVERTLHVPVYEEQPAPRRRRGVW